MTQFQLNSARTRQPYQKIARHPGLAFQYLRQGEGGYCSDCGLQLESPEKVVVSIQSERLYCCVSCAKTGEHLLG